MSWRLSPAVPTQVSLFRCRVFRSFRLQAPLTPTVRAWVVLPVLCRMVGDRPAISLRGIAGALGLRLYRAGSSRSQAESSSLALRTNRSPRVAPHPASRRRSYLRVREAKPPLDGDLHPANSYTITGAHRGREKAKAPPLPPNRTGGFPASGSPVDGLTREGIDTPSGGPLPDCNSPAWQRTHSATTDAPGQGRCRPCPVAGAASTADDAAPNRPRP
jgi:hypothetical protein